MNRNPDGSKWALLNLNISPRFKGSGIKLITRGNPIILNLLVSLDGMGLEKKSCSFMIMIKRD